MANRLIRTRYPLWANAREARGGVASSVASATILDGLRGLDYSHLGMPFVYGQVNLAGGDNDLEALDYGHLGMPFVAAGNI